MPGHSGVQVSGIFEAAGATGLSTQNAVIVVSAATPVFSYAAVLDNRTTDPIFVVGAPDQLQAGAPSPTPTPTAGQTFIVNVGQRRDLLHRPDQRDEHDHGSRRRHGELGLGGDLSHGTSSGTCTGGGGGGYGG